MQTVKRIRAIVALLILPLLTIQISHADNGTMGTGDTVARVDVLTLREITARGTSLPLELTFTKKGKAILPRIDINSTLELHLDKDRLLTALTIDRPTRDLPEELFQQASVLINQLDRLSKQYLDFQKKMGVVKRGEDLTKDQIRAIAAMADSLDGLRRYLDQDTIAQRMYGDILMTRRMSTVPILLEILQTRAGQLRDEVSKRLGADSVRIRLAAFYVHQGVSVPVHLDSFDNYKPNESYWVPTFKWGMDENQLAQFKQLQDSAATLRAENRNVISTLTEAANSPIHELMQMLQSNAKAWRDSLNAGRLDKLKNSAPNLLQSVRYYIQSVEDLGPTSINMSPVEIDMKVHKLIEAGPAMRQLVAELYSPTVRNVIANDLLKPLEKSIQKLGEMPTVLYGVLQVQNSAKTLSNIGDEVYSLQLDNLPSQTTLPMTQLPGREVWDQVEINLVVADTPTSPERILQQYRISIAHKRSYGNTLVGLIFANDRIKNEGSDFSPSASVSYLLQLPYARTYNPVLEWLRPGIGINVASLDFENDNRLELGLGGAVSLGGDFILLGYGYNIVTDQSYWFFGLNVPLTVLNMAGAK